MTFKNDEISFLLVGLDSTSLMHTNTCPLDSMLQLMLMLWTRCELLDDMICDDLVLLSAPWQIDDENEKSHSIVVKCG